MKPPATRLHSAAKYFSSSISNKIIIPYALLTAILAAFGVFVVTQLVAGSFEARLKNQLLEAGRVVSDEVVGRESFRLEVERAVANTIGVPEALVNRDFKKLNELALPIIANSKSVDSLVIVDTQGKEVLRLQREAITANAPVVTYQASGADFFNWPVVTRVLAGAADGSKDTQLARDPNSNELIIYTVGPVQSSTGIVGAVLVGTYLQKELELLHNLALADLTLFDESANVMATTLPLDRTEAAEVFKVFTPARYRQVLAEKKVTLLDEIEKPQDIETGSQTYRLAYAPFLLRGRVFGVYAVALPTNFVTDTNNQSRNRLVLIFSLGVMAVFGIGYVVSRRIIQPLIHLMETSRAITAGDLNRKTGLRRDDEIGVLAGAFDQMTDELQRLLKIQKEEASKLNAILSSIADGVIVLDLKGEILLMNPAAETILAAMGDELPVHRFQEVDSEQQPGQTPVQSAQLLNSLTNLEFHETRRFEMGRRMMSALAAPVMTPEGQQLGSVIALRDITREVEAEKLKDDFITSVSHELRTPLTAIKGYLDLLRLTAAAKLNERQITFIETIDENVKDLLGIIQQMLDLSQIDANELGIDQEPVDLTELVEAEAANWAERMAARDLSFTAHLPDESIWIEGDRNRLSQVVNSLLDNAYNYTLAGGRVEIFVKQENGQGQVDIKDTGVGTLKKDQPYLFTRFFRAIHDEKTFDVSGAGLALYISKAIIEAHHGQIWFESEPNQGSTFSFALPIIDPAQLEDVGNESMAYFEPESLSQESK